MNTQERILLEEQVRQLDELQRSITMMRSALVTRLEIVVTEPVTTSATTRVRRRTAQVEAEAAVTRAEAHVEAEAAVARAVAEAQALRDSGAPAITIDIHHTVTAEAQAEADAAVARAVAERATARAPVRTRPIRVPIARIPISQRADHRARMLEERRRRIEENRVNRRLRLDWERVATEQEYFKIKTVNNDELESHLPDVCGICLENHKMKETVMCSCNHVFGKECYNGWRNQCINNYKPIVTCPTCREPVQHETSYISRPDQVVIV